MSIIAGIIQDRLDADAAARATLLTARPAAEQPNGMEEWQAAENHRLATLFLLPRDLHAALATAAEGFPAWDVLDAAHMLVASLIVDLVADGDRPGFLRKMDRVLRDRVKEIAARQRPRLVV